MCFTYVSYYCVYVSVKYHRTILNILYDILSIYVNFWESQ